MIARLSFSVLLLAASPARAFWLGPRAQSRWRDGKITVDGSADDWTLKDSDDTDGLAFAFANDGKDFYLLILPHTRALKAQVDGSYGQDLALWIDPKAGNNRKIGFKLRAPGGDGGRELEVVLDTASARALQGGDKAELRVGRMEGRGALEARIPLSYFGDALPRRVSVGLEASQPVHPPGRLQKADSSAPEQGKDQTGFKLGRKSGGREARGTSGAQDQDFIILDFWVRVDLASPPQ